MPLNMTKNTMKVIWTDNERKAELVCEKCKWSEVVTFHFNKTELYRMLDVGAPIWECRNSKNEHQCEIPIWKPGTEKSYCTWDFICSECDLSFYGLDCMGNPI